MDSSDIEREAVKDRGSGDGHCGSATLFSVSDNWGAHHFVRAFSATFRDFSAMNLQLNPGNRLITNRRYSEI
jgi:hypothetical protein